MVEQSFGHWCKSQALKMENNFAGIVQERIISSPLDFSLCKHGNLSSDREKIFLMVTTEVKLIQAQKRTAEDLEQVRGEVSTTATYQSLGASPAL